LQLGVHLCRKWFVNRKVRAISRTGSAMSKIVTPPCNDQGMESNILHDAVALLEKANANLEPELMTADAARVLLAEYARAEKLAAFGQAALARKIDDTTEIARVTGTSIGKAKQTVETGKALKDADLVCDAFAGGAISLDQATEIAKAEQARPGSAPELLELAETEAFHVLQDKARKIKLESEQGGDLFARQHRARSARTYNDELGLVHIHLALEPRVGTPIMNRAHAEAGRLYRKAKRDGGPEPFERHLADAYAGLLTRTGNRRPPRPELVVVVSHEVTQRGWTEVKDGEVCKIPGVGPVAPQVAREIAADAFLSGVFYDGKDLRHFRRWTRNTPVEVAIALQLGPPPDFHGVRCVDCGNRFGNENDHVEPHAAYGPASTGNLRPRCWTCHKAKTERDRKAGKLTPLPPGAKRAPP
jgi:5-methylcytosine-specific restriction endonuclease McrA